MKRAVVVGAGLAGLSAAVRLSDEGFHVTVLESRSSLGGRARQLEPNQGGPPIDFGQHLMLGCYHGSIDFARRLGSAHLLRPVEGPTPFLSGPDRLHPYRLSRLPAPLHALPALVGLTQLGRRERIGLLRPLAAARIGLERHPGRLDELDVNQWLRSHGQSSAAIDGFWEPLNVATLNLPTREASAFLLATVLVRGFVGGRDDAQPLLVRSTLHELFVAPAVRSIERAGGLVLRQRRVRRIVEAKQGSVGAVETDTGERYSAEQFVLGVPSWNLGGLVSDLSAMADTLRRVEALGSSPIVNVDLWFDRRWMRYPYVGLLGSPVQWVFDDQRHEGGSSAADGFRVSLVISSAREQIGLRAEELVELGVAELERYFAEAAAAEVIGSLVTRAPQATIRGRPGQRSLRPGAATTYRNLWLAGDWTSTDLPATIESAVVSGQRAARAAAGLADAGATISSRPDTPGLFSRLIAHARTRY